MSSLEGLVEMLVAGAVSHHLRTWRRVNAGLAMDLPDGLTVGRVGVALAPLYAGDAKLSPRKDSLWADTENCGIVPRTIFGRLAIPGGPGEGRRAR